MKYYLILFAFLLCSTIAGQAQSVEHIIQQNITARGGLGRIENVHSIRMSGHANMNGVDAPFVIMMERPRKLRIELRLPRATIVQAYNGQIGWARIPKGNGSEIRQMTPTEAQSLKDQADFDGPLVRYKQKHNTVSLQGNTRVDSVAAYKLLVVNPEGEKTTMLVDTRTYHIIREVTHKKVSGANPVSSYMSKIETNYTDFKNVQGLVLPYTIETVVDGNKISKLKIDTISLNTVFPDSLFDEPSE